MRQTMLQEKREAYAKNIVAQHKNMCAVKRMNAIMNQGYKPEGAAYEKLLQYN